MVLPDFHTDIEFAKAFRVNMERIDWKVAALHWTPEFDYPDHVKLLPTSTKALDEEMGNCGDYLLILYLDKDKLVEIGTKGIMNFPQGIMYISDPQREI